MKLTEAARKGCQITKKAIHTYVGLDERRVPVEACYVGAAMLGFGLPEKEHYAEAIMNRFSVLKGAPIYDGLPEHIREEAAEWVLDGSMMELLFFLNDHTNMTREEISDWLDRLEEKGKVDLEEATYVDAVLN